MPGFFTTIFGTTAVTSDRAKDPTLRSRYYRLSRERIWPMIMETLANMPDCKITHEVQNVGEVLLVRKTITGRVQDITITVIQENPLKTSVDVYSASEDSIWRLGDLGSNYRLIQRFFKLLDERAAAHKLNH